MLGHLKALLGVAVCFLFSWAVQMRWPDADPALLFFLAFLAALAWLAIHYRARLFNLFGRNGRKEIVASVAFPPATSSAGLNRRCTLRRTLIRGALVAPLLLALGAIVWWPLEQKSSVGCLQDHLSQLSWALDEGDVQHLYQELKVLYPRLETCDLHTPMLEPVNIGHEEYDNTRYGFHLTFLKVLHRWIRNGDVDISQWNVDVGRENAKRKRVSDNHLRRCTHKIIVRG